MPGNSRSLGSSAQMKPASSPLGSRKGTQSQWRFQAQGPRPFCCGLIRRVGQIQQFEGVDVLEQVAALVLELRSQDPGEPVDRDRDVGQASQPTHAAGTERACRARRPARWRRARSPSAWRMPVADRLEDVGVRAGVGDAGRDRRRCLSAAWCWACAADSRDCWIAAAGGWPIATSASSWSSSGRCRSRGSSTERMPVTSPSAPRISDQQHVVGVPGAGSSETAIVGQVGDEVEVRSPASAGMKCAPRGRVALVEQRPLRRAARRGPRCSRALPARGAHLIPDEAGNGTTSSPTRRR